MTGRLSREAGSVATTDRATGSDQMNGAKTNQTQTMTQKTISTPDVFSSSGNSRGVSNVIGTASLIVLALGLVGTMSIGLSGFADGLGTDLDGKVVFQQDEGDVTITIRSISDDVATMTFATDVADLTNVDLPPLGSGTALDGPNEPRVGQTVTGSSFTENDVITVAVTDGNGNSEVIARYTVNSAS